MEPLRRSYTTFHENPLQSRLQRLYLSIQLDPRPWRLETEDVVRSSQLFDGNIGYQGHHRQVDMEIMDSKQPTGPRAVEYA